jgi:DNA-binding MarR family transcriptional regulator
VLSWHAGSGSLLGQLLKHSCPFMELSTEPQPSAVAIRGLLNRKDLAAARHRAALADVLGVTETELIAIAHLAQHGELTPTGLGRLLALSSAGATAVVQRLERTGFVERAPHPSDGRSAVLRLSAEGAARAEAAMAPLVEDLDRIAAALEPASRRAVGAFLREVAEVSERHAAHLRDEAGLAGTALASAPVPGLWA